MIYGAPLMSFHLKMNRSDWRSRGACRVFYFISMRNKQKQKSLFFSICTKEIIWCFWEMYFPILARHPWHYECQHMNFRPVTFAWEKQTNYGCIMMPFERQTMVHSTLQTIKWAKLSTITFSDWFKVKYLSDCKEEKEKKHTHLISEEFASITL